MESTTKRPIGLPFAGSTSPNYFNSMDVVVSLLSRPHENKHLSNQTKFGRVFPINVIKRYYCTTPLSQQGKNFQLVSKETQLQRNLVQPTLSSLTSTNRNMISLGLLIATKAGGNAFASPALSSSSLLLKIRKPSGSWQAGSLEAGKYLEAGKCLQELYYKLEAAANDI